MPSLDRPINSPGALAERLADVRGRIAAAADRSGRPPQAVTLVAVTKGHPAATAQELIGLGQVDLGENRARELVEKCGAIESGARWHFIGHLQRNKARLVVGRAVLIHSIDSPGLIAELEKEARRRELRQDVLLELNLAREATRTGALAEDLPALLDALAKAPHLRALGLMTMAPADADPEAARPCFAELRRLLGGLTRHGPLEPRHLSMGMSGDFEVAIEEGATIVRIGTALLGERAAP